MTSLDGTVAPSRPAGRRSLAGSLAPGAQIAAASAGALALTLVLFWVGVNSTIVDRPVLFAGLRTLSCIGLLAIALSAVARGTSERLAALLVVCAYFFALNGLTSVDAPLPFAIGRVMTVVTLLLIAYVALSYPRGRLDLRVSVRFMEAATIGTVVLFVANLLLSRYPPVAGPFVRCSGSDCPPNPLAIVDLGAGASHAMSSAFGLWTTALVTVVAVLVARRAQVATRLQRRSLAPVLTWALLMSLGYAAFVAVRVLDSGSPQLTSASVVVATLVAAMPVAIAAGIMRGRVFAIGGLERMLARLGDRTSPRVLEQAMAGAFDDPSLRLLVRLPGGDRHVDVNGEAAELPPGLPEEKVTRIERRGHTVATLVHDAALTEEPEVLEAAGSALLLALENASLEARLRESAAELEASRERIARAAGEERERIERDLHDGAQQQLVALRIRLALLEERAAADPQAIVPELARAGRDIELALEQIRRLAHGIYPPELRDAGVAAALRSIAREMPVPVSIRDTTTRRFPNHVETAVYFCCVEALQNVAKHGGSAARADVRLFQRRRGELGFEVEDDGPGFEPGRPGSPGRGLTGMADRLAAVGGHVSVESAPGAGTTVAGRVPL